jgi:hypothetical protein
MDKQTTGIDGKFIGMILTLSSFDMVINGMV